MMTDPHGKTCKTLASMNRNESPYLPLGRQARIYEPLCGSKWSWTKRRCGRDFVENLLDPEMVFFILQFFIWMYIYIYIYSIHSRLNFLHTFQWGTGTKHLLCFTVLLAEFNPNTVVVRLTTVPSLYAGIRMCWAALFSGVKHLHWKKNAGNKTDVFPQKVPGEKRYLAVIMSIPPPGGAKQDYSSFSKPERTRAMAQPWNWAQRSLIGALMVSSLKPSYSGAQNRLTYFLMAKMKLTEGMPQELQTCSIFEGEQTWGERGRKRWAALRSWGSIFELVHACARLHMWTC